MIKRRSVRAVYLEECVGAHCCSCLKLQQLWQVQGGGDLHAATLHRAVIDQ